MAAIEIRVNKTEVKKELNRGSTSLKKNEEIEWNDYSGNISGSEAMCALFQLGSKFSTLISKMYTMSIQDWEELQDIYDMYCKLDSDSEYPDEKTPILQKVRAWRGTVLLNRDKRDFEGVEFSRRAR